MIRLRIEEFIAYLKEEKQASRNTLLSYERDLRKMESYLRSEGILQLDRVTTTSLRSYLIRLEDEGLSGASISRHISSMHSYFRCGVSRRWIHEDPSEPLRAPRVSKKQSPALTREEMERLMEQPDTETAKGLRDAAMLRLMGTTGLRVSEMTGLSVEDVDLKRRTVTCRENGRERTIPLTDRTVKALRAYLKQGREELAGEGSNELFTNISGERLSRQGFWKLLKTYGEKAGIETELTPHRLRHSCAVHMLEAGKDPQTVREILGNSDPASTQQLARQLSGRRG